MNLLGMSLPFVYLTGKSQTAFEALLGPADVGLAQLKNRGVNSIEIRAAQPHDDPDLAELAAQRVWDAGLELSIHGGLPAFPIQTPFETSYPLLHRLAGLLNQQGKIAPVAIHAYQHKTTAPDQLAQQTVAAFGYITTLCKEQNLPFRFALELNRTKQLMDPANTYESVLAMHDQINHPNVGLCWDFGHGYSNYTNGLIAEHPPVSFLKSVIHTHIHDLAPHGKTHWPLTERRLPLQAYVDLLKSVNYQGVWNMELDPERYKDQPDITPQILQSIDLLRQAVGD